MKTRSKALLLSLCAVLLVAASVFGTMAYLTSTDKVTNTFSVGSVSITLDEKDVDNDGNTEDNVTVNDVVRDKANSYKLMPGHTYVKDPTVHVNASSEDSWIFVKVENGISAYEAATSEEGDNKTIAGQITANGWKKLENVDDVYYKEYTKNENGMDLVVFESFKIADNANEVEGWTSIKTESTKINVTAYAVQKDGFDTAAEAWDATFGNK